MTDYECFKQDKCVLDTRCPYESNCRQVEETRAKLTDQTRQEIRDLGGSEGWWHTSGQEEFESLAGEMTSSGVTQEKAVEWLTRAYAAVADQYGD